MRSKLSLIVVSLFTLACSATAVADIAPGAPEGSCCMVEGIEGRSHKVTGDDGKVRWSCGEGLAWSPAERKNLETLARKVPESETVLKRPVAKAVEKARN